MNYEKISLNGIFYTVPGWYFFFMPIRVPYGKIAQKAEADGFVVKQGPEGIFNGILESGKSFGKGWIAVEIEHPEPEDHLEDETKLENIRKIEGEFDSIIHKGSYKKIGDTYKKIMNDHPEATEFYNLYLNAPGQAQDEKEQRTMVLFR